MRSFDIVAAFLIGQDLGEPRRRSGSTLRPPPEWRPIWEEWVREQPPALSRHAFGGSSVKCPCSALMATPVRAKDRRLGIPLDEPEEVLCVKP